jgi:predicted Fe-Mo cluster-binding NifX family protein
MRVAMPTWNDRVSPVFDAARHLLVVDVEDNAEVSRSEAVFEETALPRRAERLAYLGVNVLICGAISKPLEQMVAALGMTVIPHTCGPVEEVLRAFLSGQLAEQAFLMPGCGRRRGLRGRQRLGRRRHE